jgi:prepilin-type N-terminal cleavage/methylation domain-containing protein
VNGRSTWHSPHRSRTESGFSLIELLVVMVILPLVIAAIAVALLTVFRNQQTTSSTISSSADTSVVSSEFVSDVQSAATVTTVTSPSNPSTCLAPGQVGATQLVSFASADGNTEISYVSVPQGTNNVVFRNLCHPPSTNPVSSTVVAHTAQSVQAVIAGLPCPQTLNQGPTCPASQGWTSAAGTAYAKLTITAPIPKTSTTYSYSLQAAPRVSNPSSSGIPGGGTTSALLLGSSGDDWSCGGALTVDQGQLTMDSTSGGASGGTVTASGGVYTADSVNPSDAVSGTTLKPAGAPVTSGPPIPDPYLHLAPPIVPALSPTNNGPIGGHFQPGLYTTTPLTGPNTTLDSGIYYLESGMTIGAGTTTGNGVFIYVAAGIVNTTGIVNLTLSPLASPPSPASNMTIWQSSTDTNPMTLDGTGGGSGSSVVNGLIYAPNAAVHINGGGSSLGLQTDGILAKQVTCTGNHAPFTVTGNL